MTGQRAGRRRVHTVLIVALMAVGLVMLGYNTGSRIVQDTRAGILSKRGQQQTDQIGQLIGTAARQAQIIADLQAENRALRADDEAHGGMPPPQTPDDTAPPAGTTTTVPNTGTFTTTTVPSTTTTSRPSPVGTAPPDTTSKPPGTAPAATTTTTVPPTPSTTIPAGGPFAPILDAVLGLVGRL